MAGLGKSFLALNRRQFLIASASASLSPGVAIAFSQDQDADTSIWFDLSPDERSLTVWRVAEPRETDQTATEPPDPPFDTWTLSADAFGPEAIFDLEAAPPQPKSPPILVIRRASFGGIRSATLKFRFEKSENATKAKVWKVGLETDLWRQAGKSKSAVLVSPAKGPSLASLSGTSPEKAAGFDVNLAGSAVDTALRRIFDDLVTFTQRKAALHISPSFNWTIKAASSTEPSGISVLQGRVSGLGDFSFGWSKTGDGTWSLAADSKAELAKPVILGPIKGTAVNLKPANAKLDLNVTVARDVQIDKTSTDLSFSGTLVRLTGAQLDLSCQTGVTVLDNLPVTDIHLAQLWGPNRVLRTSAWGVAAGSSSEPKVHKVTTRIGRMFVTSLSTLQKTAEKEPDPQTSTTQTSTTEAADTSTKTLGNQVAAALGNRSGIASDSFYALADGIPCGKPPARLLRFDCGVALRSIDTTMTGTSHSSLRFDRPMEMLPAATPGAPPRIGSRLAFSWSDGDPLSTDPSRPIAEQPLASAPSWVWMGPSAPGDILARIDLTNAAAEARRDVDLVDLTFRFGDMVLDYRMPAKGQTTTPQILPRQADCRVLVSPEGVQTDNRPTLSVEFAPQHVMEEAFFTLQPPPLPDAPTVAPGDTTPSDPNMASARAILDHLASLTNIDKRVAFRQTVQAKKTKVAQDLRGKVIDGKSSEQVELIQFETFATAFETRAVAAKLPEDQQIYIGPIGLDPDAMAIAREQQESDLGKALAGIPLQAKKDAENHLTRLELTTVMDLQEALRRESIAAEAQPLYGLWRNCWQDTAVEAGASTGMEPFYLLSNNLPPDFNAGRFPDPPEQTGSDQNGRAFEKMLNRLQGKESLNLARARLSGKSYLAFRLNCLPEPGDKSTVNGLPDPQARPGQPGPLGNAFAGMPFDFAALTDWSHHDPAVTKRAQKLFPPDATGEILPLAGQSADLTPADMLAYQGIQARDGDTGATRMPQIQASVSLALGPMETRIEPVSRLIMSTAQDAEWRTTRGLKAPAPELDQPAPPKPEPVPQIAGGRAVTLWTARLITSEAGQRVDPGLRVVASPDFRPGALSRHTYTFDEPAESADAAKTTKIDRYPGQAAPPHGALAPWHIGRDQWDGEVATDTLKEDACPDPGTPVQPAPAAPGSSGSNPPAGLASLRAWITDQFCKRVLVQKKGAELGQSMLLFRSSLDAYDRHELVLLSSAYGLPVLPGDASGAQSQFQPTGALKLADGGDQQAIYIPQQLAVEELTLTALGASFHHDTSFSPPAPLRDAENKPMWDGLSISRWQHRTELGRDIVATVVYAGYLFPLGHHASLVKVTERVFRKISDHGIKAPLQQRMFIRVSEPTKSYPAVGQPNSGRGWFGKPVEILTRTTPDIVDPYLAPGKSEKPVAINGRIHLKGAPGLAFWPKTSMSESGQVMFDLSIDGKVTSLPLIFVDKVAVQSAPGIEQLVAYYNGLSQKMARNPDTDMHADRLVTANLGGQPLEYAPSRQSGDTSLSTARVVLKAEGQTDAMAGWVGDNTNYSNSAILETAGQPPFYPVLRAAQVRLEQVESLSGSAARPVWVRLDGAYIQGGLNLGNPHKYKEDAPNDAQKANDAGVFLYMADWKSRLPRLDMGSNGDKSGGIAQGNVLGRGYGQSGVLGCADKYWVRLWDPSPRVFTPKSGEPDKSGLLIDEETFSVAPGFTLLPVSIKRQKQAEESRRALAPQKSVPDPEVSQTFNAYFDPSAKILGVISFEELIKLLVMEAGKTVLPVLEEVAEYGSEALQELNEKSAEAMDLVRRDILLPLRDLTGKVDQAIKAFDAKLGTAQAGTPGQTLLFSSVFPEITSGLTSLQTALQNAIDNDDPTAALGRLARVYEAAKRFTRQLADLSTNFLSRLGDAVTNKIKAILSATQIAIEQLVNEVTKAGETFIKDLKTRITQELDAIAADAFEKLLNALDFPLPWTEALEDLGRIAALADAGTADAKALETLLPKVTDALSVIPISGEAEGSPKWVLAQIYNFLTASSGSESAEAMMVRVFGALVDRLRTPINAAKKEILDAQLQSMELQDALTETVNHYSGLLDQVVGDLHDDLKTDRALAAWLTDIRRAKLRGAAILSQLKALYAATQDPKQALQLVKVLLELIGYGDVPTDIQSLLNDYAAKLATKAKDQLAALFGINGTFPTEVAGLCRAGQFKKAAERVVDLSPKDENPAIPVAISQMARVVKGLTHTPDQLKQIANSLAKETKLDPYLAARAAALLNDLQEMVGLIPKIFGDMVRIRAEADLLAKITGKPFDATIVRNFIDAEKAGLASLARNLTSLFKLLAKDGTALATVGAVAGILQELKDLHQKNEKDFDGLKQWFLDQETSLATSLRLATVWLVNRIDDLGGETADAATGLKALAGKISGVPTQFLAVERDDVAKKLIQLAGSISTLGTDLNESNWQAIYPKNPGDTIKFDDFVQRVLKIAKPIADALPGHVDEVVTNLNDVQIALSTVVSRVKGYANTIEQKLVTAALAMLDGPTKAMLDIVISAHDAITQARNAAYADASADPVFRFVANNLIIGTPTNADKQAETDDLAQFNKTLSDFSKTPPPNIISDGTKRKELRDILTTATSGQDPLTKLMLQLKTAVTSFLGGDFLALIDVGMLRHEIEERIAALIPLRKTLSYNLDFEISGGGQDVFDPKPGGRFTLEMQSTIDLLNKKVTMHAGGHIGPFDIHLVGKTFDALTLSFDGASFSMDGGGGPKFDVFYRDFKIGKQLQFIEKLSKWLKPSDGGDGFFIEPLKGKPGIKAGYGISLPVISLGNVSFSGVTLNAAVNLPFDNSEATFEVSLGRLMAPFMIAAAPYAGTGFVAIEANAKGIIGFEMSLAFGGGGAFQAGPLTGQGFIQAGFYIHSATVDGKKYTSIYATFFAGGSASIWIFNISASLFVRLGHDGQTGAMEGIAIFSFSFSMGFAHFDYRCEFHQKRDALGGGKNDGGKTDASKTPPPASAKIAAKAQPPAEPKPAAEPEPEPEKVPLRNVIRQTKGAEENLDTYLGYFELELAK